MLRDKADSPDHGITLICFRTGKAANIFRWFIRIRQWRRIRKIAWCSLPSDAPPWNASRSPATQVSEPSAIFGIRGDVIGLALGIGGTLSRPRWPAVGERSIVTD